MRRENPVRLLLEAPVDSLGRAARSGELLARANGVHQAIQEDLSRPLTRGSPDRPVAFLCAEFGVHRSLPTYGGGLGILAGDFLKEGADRGTTARLYSGDRTIRLAQYALLGIGGIRVLRAMGIDPAVVHVNEGHGALAALELAREEVAAGRSFDAALEAARARTVFTTHTPVPAGNETYSPEE